MYIIGIDGGGTKTNIAIFDDTGKFSGIIHQKYPSSIDSITFNEIHNKIKQSVCRNIHHSCCSRGVYRSPDREF